MRPLLLAVALTLTPLAPAASAAAIDDAGAAYARGALAAARSAFTRLSRQGLPAADYNLAVMHLRAEFPHASPREALRLMTRAAEAGFVTAIFGLAQLHEQGQAGLRVDLVEATRWYQRAAELGNSEGMSSLAVMLENGSGLTQDYGRAAEYYRLAANAGDARGYLGLGSLTARGAGVRASPAEALKLFQAAADRGSVAAMRNLGIMYEGGQGAPTDRKKAIDYYRKAAAAGDEASRADLQRLGAR